MLDARQALITAEEAHRAGARLAALRAEYPGGAQAAQAVPASVRAELERLERVRSAAVHPQTGEAILVPLRLSMVVPVNTVLDGLMLSARSPAQTILAQTTNQTYNALHYYANRNATQSEGVAELLGAYCAATASSVSVALYLKSARFAQSGVRMLAPFLAVAAADVLNLGIMRHGEYMKGVHVYLADDSEPPSPVLQANDPLASAPSEAPAPQPVGTSRRAGLMATGSCIFARCVVALPILAGSPLLVAAAEQRSEFLRARPRLRLPLALAIVAGMIQFSVPLVFGIFRQDMVVPASWLEPDIAAAAPGRKVYFNRGL
jgi:hypothetical protein